MPTSLRIPVAAKRRGISAQKFIVEAALREASRSRVAEEQLAYELVSVTLRHLARVKAEEDAEDARVGDAEWEQVKAGKSRIMTPEKAKSGLGLQNFR